MTRSIQQLLNLEGKNALITGGSRGLGLQMAESLGEAGAKVMITARKSAAGRGRGPFAVSRYRRTLGRGRLR